MNKTIVFTNKTVVSHTFLPSLAVLLASFVTVGCQSTAQTSASSAISNTLMKGFINTQTQYQDKRYFTIAGQNMPVIETSARLLANTQQNAPELVADIYDGKGSRVVPGYKIQLINRTSSLLAEGREKDGKIFDNRMIHRGTKSLIGIPVSNGNVLLNQAVLLDFDVIYDNPTLALAKGDIAKPRGNKMTKTDTVILDKKVVIRSLTLPNFATGESAGGGVDFEASAMVDGKLVTTGANSTFQIFDTVAPDKARGF